MVGLLESAWDEWWWWKEVVSLVYKGTADAKDCGWVEKHDEMCGCRPHWEEVLFSIVRPVSDSWR